MAEPTFSHQGHQGYPSEQRESHWLPALRPDTDADLPDETQVAEEEKEEVKTPRYSQMMDDQRDPSIGNKSQQAVFQDSNFLADDDTEQLDPAWGFQRTESTQLLNSARRSSSFPHSTEPDQATIDDQSFANGFSRQPTDIDFDELLNGAQTEAEPVANAFAGTIDDHLDDNAPHDSIADSGQLFTNLPDSRFEEGVPLISHAEADPQPQSLPKNNGFAPNSFEEAVADDNDTSFFSQIPRQLSNEHDSFGLERKSTEDVIDAVQENRWEKLLDFTEDPETLSVQEIFGRTAEDAPVIEETPAVEPRSEDPSSKWAAVLDDDEFLIEDVDDLLPESDPGSPSSFMAALKSDDLGGNIGTENFNLASHQQSSVPPTPTNPYAPHQPSTSDMMQLSPKAHGNVGLTRAGLKSMGSFQNHIQQPTIVTRAESFADQAKGGYKSPYDLPMDLSKPKKRPQVQRIASQSQKGAPPPPRSASMTSQTQPQAPSTPVEATFGSVAAGAVQSPPATNRSASATMPSSSVPVRQTSTSTFFEELPMTSKPRPSGRYTPAQPVLAAPPPLPPATPPMQEQSTHYQITASPPRISNPYTQYDLQPPERVDPYANIALQPPSAPGGIAPTNRYSPAPTATIGAGRPSSTPRYSPAPPVQALNGGNRYASQPVLPPQGQGAGNRYVSQPTQMPSANPTMTYLPRTSSPLAYHGKPAADQGASLMPPPPAPRTTQPPQAQPPPRQSTPPTAVPSQTSHLHFSPPKLSDPSHQTGFAPPRRSQTQSPGRQMPRSALAVPLDAGNNRPATAVGQAPILKNYTATEQPSMNYVINHVKAAAPEQDFEQPQDESRNDPLQRWRGAPIFRFGFGGAVVSSFPKHTPRYKPGQIKPQIKSTAGEVRTRVSKDLSLLPEHMVSFPGPLKSKSKKKDLLSWMSTTIVKLERDSPAILGNVQTLPDPRKCHEELILLWKIVRIFVEHDGIVDNKPEALKALNVLLSPEVHAIDESTASQYRGDVELTGIYSPAGTNVRADSLDPLAVENLRKHLLKGEREQAVWKAADSRLWSHALLLASSFRDEGKMWRQVVQEFVRQEVKTIGNNSEALSALYEIFGGNMEESIDQLVPPSARAGLQMVSKLDTTGPTKNALDGLNRWKETLSLVLNNRTPDDQRALATLGALLGNYGRVQAAHICFLFARNPSSPNIFGGVDDSQASITLLGSDRRATPLSFHQDHDAVLLTEAYEFAISILAPPTTSVSLPHLSAYKLRRALDLADNGYKSEAQAYCEAITSGITSKNKLSPYYNTSLLMEVDELNKRLKQVPVQSTSWIAKPSVERATSSLLSKITNFVAGDDSDAESKGSAADIGPFAKTTGSPGLSRSGSQTDLYGSYPPLASAIPMTAAGSRYHPGGITSARSSTDLTRGRTSLDSQRSPPATSYGQEPRQSLYAPSKNLSQTHQSPARSVNSFQQFGTSPSRSNYQPTPPQPSYMPDPSSNQSPVLSQENKSDSYVPFVPVSESSAYQPVHQGQDLQQPSIQPSFGGYTPPVTFGSENTDALPEDNTAGGYEQPQSYGYGYEPPADTGYVPYQPDPESDDDSAKKQKSKKKSLMEDNDNFTGKFSQVNQTSKSNQDDSSAATSSRKKANDEAADAAFKAAAEADEQRAKELAAQKKAGGGWLGGWFGGKKNESLDSPKSSSSADAKVYKAKLGEDKMKLYYDKDLKKWVNPDDPDSGKAKSTPPPPPPGRSSAPPPSAGPPRAGGTPAPPMIGSRSSTPATVPGTQMPSTGLGIGTMPPSVNVDSSSPAGTPPPTNGAITTAPPAVSGLAAPSRPAINASSIDDLIGPATGRKGPKGRGAKKGRYVDVMAQ